MDGLHYVISDIHGNVKQVRSILDQIQLRQEDSLYVLGDVIDRHPGGLAIMSELMNIPNVQMVLGNHEYMMLRALDPLHFYNTNEVDVDRLIDDVEIWYANGGQVTHRGIKLLSKEARESLFAYLRGLPLSINVIVNGRNFVLVHAAPPALYSKHCEEYESVRKFSVWYRVPSDEPITEDPNTTVIFGHTPTVLLGQNTDPLEIFWGDHRIGIDCGAAFPNNPEEFHLPRGRLACLRLEDLKEYYSD